MKLKKFFVASILLLSVGFASVSTTLVMNGNVKIATNVADFDVSFTKAILDGSNISSPAISADGKKVTYRTSNLSAVGNKSTLNFEVINYSEMYDAKVSVNCTAEANNSSYKITTSEEIEVAGKTTGAGNVVVELLNSSVGNENFTCTLTTIAKERTTKAEIPVPVKYTPKYFELGDPTASSTQDYRTLTYSSASSNGKQAKIFVGLDEEGQKSVCILRNDDLNCFKNNNWKEENTRIIEVFGQASCSSDSSSVTCKASDFNCYSRSDGVIRCRDNVANFCCYVDSNDNVRCY